MTPEVQFKYGYPDTCYTNHQRPTFYADLCAETEEAWKDYMRLTDFEPLPYEALGEQLDKCRQLESRKDKAYHAWMNGDDPESEEIPF